MNKHIKHPAPWFYDDQDGSICDKNGRYVVNCPDSEIAKRIVEAVNKCQE